MCAIAFFLMNRRNLFVCCVIVVLGQIRVFAAERYAAASFAGRNYVVIASQIIKPRSPFAVSVHIFDNPVNVMRIDNRSVGFYISITSGQEELIYHKQMLYWNTPQIVYIMTPSTLTPMEYELHVRATNDVNEMVIFDEKSALSFDSRFVSVVFQTTRPIYCAGQTVRFRILVLEMNLLPFNDVLDLYLIDPDGFIVRRWLSVYTNNGVLSMKFKLPKLAKNGVWKIRSKIDYQIDEKSIYVETYYRPLFEVIVSSVAYIASSVDHIDATLYGIYSSQKHVHGNATVLWSARKLGDSYSNFTAIHSSTFVVRQKHNVSLPLESLRNIFEDISNVEVKILAYLTELMSGETVSGYTHTRIITNKIMLKFLPKPPLIFTPGNFIRGYVIISYEDHERVPIELLQSLDIKVQMDCDVAPCLTEIRVTPASVDEEYFNGELYDKLVSDFTRARFLETSVLPFRFEVPEKANQVKLKAILTNDEDVVEIEATALKRYDMDDLYLNVWTTSEDLLVGDYAAFHVKSNLVINVLYVLILSKGILLRVSEHPVPASTLPLFTFSETVSADMAPWFHLIVYCITNDGHIRNDAIFVPVDGFSRYKTTLEVNTGKDFRNEKVELVFTGAAGAYIGVHAVRSVIFQLQSSHEITRSRIVDSFIPFEQNQKALVKIEWTSKTGVKSKESIYYASQSYAIDSYNVFSLNRLMVFSNMKLSARPESYNCNEVRSLEPCFTEDCFYKIASCSKHVTFEKENCKPGSETREEFFIRRISWNSFIFDADEGDWAFREIRSNDHEGEEFDSIKTPRTADEWYFTAFNMDMVYGFSIIEHPVIFSTKRPLMAHLLGPHLCRRGEQLGLKLFIHNFDENEMMVTVTLLASDDYKFVHVGNEGVVATYNTRLSGQDHEILIWMAAESENEIHIPVKPTVEQGFVEIQFKVSSQSGRELLSHIVNVQGEGALVNRHTSVTLDLKNRGFVLQYLDIVVEESPIVPYEISRRYVFGSPTANLTISNSLIGPAIGTNVMLDMNMILGRESKGALDLLFELHINVWSLHYLRYTNQLEWSNLRETLYECNTLYAEIVRYFHLEGWFSHWETYDHSEPSVWLTSWALRIFKDSCYADWEFHFWIDPSIFSQIFHWFLTRQNDDGSFHEVPNARRYSIVEKLSNNKMDEELALTAHVLISLYSTMQKANSELKSDIAVACYKAREYLEKALSTIHDPHLIAVVAYALLISNSPEQGIAFIMLRKLMRVDGDGMYYWSREVVKGNPVKLENQKPYIKPRTYRDTDSSAVETTSWALLVHLIHDGVTPVVENIVQWLISIKMTENGFVSATDTAIAYQALTEFVYRSRLLDITRIDVKIELMMSSVTLHRIHIANRSSSAFRLQIPQVWGRIHITGKGSGIAFIHLDVNYGIDDERFIDTPRVSVFDLHISEFYSQHRNKSMLTVQSCLRYVANFSEISGAAVLEIQSPTGYNILESDALILVKSGVHSSLRDVRVVEGKTYWFFDGVDKELRCFNHTIKRWYPVANMTLYRNALLYEVTARERFIQVLINSTPLYVLNICEVCGSYQCPYCAYYNTGFRSITSIANILFIVILRYFLSIY